MRPIHSADETGKSPLRIDFGRHLMLEFPQTSISLQLTLYAQFCFSH
jgi:hypothetical protein